MANELFKLLPKIDELFKRQDISHVIEKCGKEPVKEALHDALSKVRELVKSGEIDTEDNLRVKCEELISESLRGLNEDEGSLKRVINATGVVLHTNLGRAPMPCRLVERLTNNLRGYMNLEYNLEKGARGERYEHMEEIICKVTGAEAAFAVNNNAAAVMLMCAALGTRKEIIVSRGEQIEIGGKFRIPDIIKRSNAKMVEVGATNKTHIRDYEESISDKTAAILKVHTSNYRIVGFTDSVERDELVSLAHTHGIPVIEDLGSGVLIDLSRYGLRKEPTVMDSLKAGVDLVSFSGDKLLGGTQAGIIVGKKELIEKCKKHPLTRAFRIDKMQALLIGEIFKMYEDPVYAVKNIPVLRMLTEDADAVWSRAEKLCLMIEGIKDKGVNLDIVETDNYAGGGSLPEEKLKGVAIRLSDKVPANVHAENLRKIKTPLIVRVEDNAVIIELRTIDDEELKTVADIINKEFA